MSTSIHNLNGDIALLTGGATGIGRAMAGALGKAGAKVWLASRDAAAIGRAVDELCTAGIAAEGAQLDVTDRAQVENLTDHIVKQDGKIDILINSAGVMIKHPVLEMPEEVWDHVIGVNLKGDLSVHAGGGARHDRARLRPDHSLFLGSCERQRDQLGLRCVEGRDRSVHANCRRGTEATQRRCDDQRGGAGRHRYADVAPGQKPPSISSSRWRPAGYARRIIWRRRSFIWRAPRARRSMGK